MISIFHLKRLLLMFDLNICRSNEQFVLSLWYVQLSFVNLRACMTVPWIFESYLKQWWIYKFIILNGAFKILQSLSMMGKWSSSGYYKMPIFQKIWCAIFFVMITVIAISSISSDKFVFANHNERTQFPCDSQGRYANEITSVS